MLRTYLGALGINILYLAQIRRIASAALICLSFQSFAQSGPVALNISGSLYDSSGKPILNSSVNFKLEVLDKAGVCVLYSEYHYAVDLNSSKGDFSLILGGGTSVNNFISGTTALDAKVFLNPGPVAAFSGCPTGATLNPGDNRLVRVSYDVGLGFVAMTPSVPMVSSAYATVADTLQGKAPTDFIQVHNNATNLLTQTNVEFAFNSTNWPRLQNLLNGNSSQYLPAAPTAPVDFNNQRLTTVGTPSVASDAANKGYVDANLGGLKLNLSSMGTTSNGMALVWDQTNSQWVPGSVATSDNTKLPLAGGTMAGNINMNGNNVLNLGVLGLGNYTSGTEATLTGSLTGANKGTTWYNSTQNMLTVWDGTTAIRQAYLDAGGKLSPSWIPNTTVTAATYGTSNQIPVFTVGADGRITSATTIALSGVAPSGTASGDLTGNYPGPTIAPNAVTTAKINNDSITSAKINSTGIAVNQLVATDAVTGTTLTYFTCSLNQIMSWTASGWACTTVSSLAPVTSVAGKTGAVTLNAADISGLGNAATQNYGTAANDLVQLNASAQLPALDGSLLTNINATKLQSRTVASTAPSAGQVLGYNGSTSQWEPTSAAAGSVTNIAAGTGLLGGPITSSGTLSVNVGNGANQIVQENASSQIVQTAGNASAPTYSFSGSTNTGLFSPFANSVALSANGTAALSVLSNGNVGVGTTVPQAGLDIATTGTASSAMIVPRDTTANRPTGINGMIRYNTSSASLEGFVNGSWQSLASGGGGASQWTTLGSNIYYNGGNVGLGTTNPSQRLTVESTSLSSFTGGTVGILGIATSDTTTGNWTAFDFSTSASSAPRARIAVQETASGTKMAFGTSNNYGTGITNQAMTIDTGGNVGIGTSSPGFMLDVVGTGRVKYNFDIASGAGQIGLNRNSVTGSIYDNTFNAWQIGMGGTAGSSLIFSSWDTTGAGILYPLTIDQHGMLTGVASSNWNYPNLALVRSASNLSSGRLISFLLNGDSVSDAVDNNYFKISLNDSSTINPSSVSSSSTSLQFYGPGNINFMQTGNVGIGTTGPQAGLDVATTGTASSAIIIPRDTTANRPAGINGMIRYNTNTATIEGYANGSWSTITGAAGGGSIWALNGTNAYYNNGNVGIGITSPASTLDVNGTSIHRGTILGYVNAGGNWPGYDPSGAHTSFAITDNLTNGVAETDFINTSSLGGGFRFYQMTGANAGTNLMTITGSGNVGIGTISPSSLLYASGTLPSVSINESNGIDKRTAINFGASGVVQFQIGTDVTVNNTKNFYLYDAPAATVRMLIDSNGNVGIGTVAPQAALDIATTGSAASAVIVPRDTTANRPSTAVNGMIRYNTNTATIEGYANGAWSTITGAAGGGSVWALNGTNAYYNNGNVGIGTTNPTNKLQVAGDISVGNNMIGAAVDSQHFTTNSLNIAHYGITIGQGQLIGGSGLHLSGYYGIPFYTNGSERMRVDSGGNVGIGTTNPAAALHIYRLDNQELLRLSSTSLPASYYMKISGVSAATGDYRIQTVNNGIAYDAMYFTGNGYVGIGTTNPASPLTVNATNGASGWNALNINTFENGTGIMGSGLRIASVRGTASAPTNSLAGDNLGAISFGGYWTGKANDYMSYGESRAGIAGYASENWVSSSNNGSYLSLYTTPNGSAAQAERIRIDNAGNVGIGTTLPLAHVHSVVYGNGFGAENPDGTALATDVAFLASYAAGNNSSLFGALNGSSRQVFAINTEGDGGTTGNRGYVAFYDKTNGTWQRDIVLNNGNVGIGTTAPIQSLDVVSGIHFSAGGTNYAYQGGYLSWNQMTGGTGETDFINAKGGGSGGFAFYNIADGAGSVGTPLMVISSAGNVGIGTTGPGYKLDVAGDVNASGCVRAGGGTLGGTCSSDERLKTDIQPFDLGLDVLLGLSPKTFRYNGLGEHPASDKPELGVIAQEVEKSAPELVVSREVKIHLGDVQTTQIKQVNYTAFTYVLINAVKELYHRWFDDSQALHREVTSLKADSEAKDQRILKLEQENAEMKERLERIEQKLNSK